MLPSGIVFSGLVDIDLKIPVREFYGTDYLYPATIFPHGNLAIHFERAAQLKAWRFFCGGWKTYAAAEPRLGDIEVIV